MDNFIEIIVPKDTVSDETYNIIDIVDKNTFINKGTVVAILESSKASIEIESKYDGYLYYVCSKGDEIKVNGTIAYISDDKEFKLSEKELIKLSESIIKPLIKEEIDVPISKPAKQLALEHNLDLNVFKGKNLIKKSDIENYIVYKDSFDIKKIFKIIDKNNKDNILIIGSKGHAKMCIDLINDNYKYKVIGLLDADFSKIGENVLGVDVISNDSDKNLLEFYNNNVKNIIIGVGGIGSTGIGIRKSIFSKVKEIGYSVPNIKHSHSSVEKSVTLGEGNQIFSNAIIGSNVKIGDNCVFGTGCIISHDCLIGNNVFIAPGAIIAGSVIIGDNTLIGMGVTILLRTKIGNNVTINNGKNIFSDVEDNIHIK